MPNTASLQLSTGMTLEAWVSPTTVSSGWRDVIYKGNDNYYLMGTTDQSGHPGGGGIFGGTNANAFATSALPTNTWSYLTTSYDGTNLRLYLNGTLTTTVAMTGAITSTTNPLTIGSDSFWGQYFSGLIDNIRIYNTALTQAQIQTDMTTPVAPAGPDTTPPSAPGTLSATAISADPCRSQLGRSHRQHRRHRLPHRTLPGRRLQQLRRDRDDHRHHNQLQRHHHRGRHKLQLPRPRKRRHPQPRPLHQHRHRLDPQPRPDPALGAGHAERDRDQRHPRRSQLERGNRQRRRHRLPDRTLPGRRLQQLRPDRDHRRHQLQRHQRRRQTPATATASAQTTPPQTSAPTPTPPPPQPRSQTGPTPVAAYAFDEGSGTTVADLSGNGNNGTLATTTWATAGKYGGALSFNGTSSRVTVPNSASLQLSTGMTLEAWVSPTTVSSGWRDVIYKGNDNYYLMGTTDQSGHPGGGGIFGGTNANAFATSALPTNTWSYLTTSYDGTNLRLYLNGTLITTVAMTGAITSTTNPLTIGSDSFWGQYFSGLIDNVRIYNTALTQTQIQTDMTTPVAPAGPDTTPPSAPGTLSATAVSADPCRSQLGRSHRQHRRHRLPHRTLPGRRLQQLRRDRDDHRHHNQLQRHHHRGRHKLQLPRPRKRRHPQPRPLHQHRHRLDRQPRPRPRPRRRAR